MPTPLADLFRQAIGHLPDGLWVAPGRVNLIGEHTDYNDGHVLPFALPLGVRVAARLRDDEMVGFVSTCETDGARLDLAELRGSVPDRFPGWYAYPAGVLWALQRAGHELRGLDLVFDSDLPVGAGLSSSAALCCATVTAVADLCDLPLSALERARIARVAENEYVGAPTGFMDQAASTLCTAGHALLLDCRDLHTEQVPLDLAAAELELLVLDTRTPHSLVDSAYAERRSSCERAAEALGVPALRDLTDVADLAPLANQGEDGELLLRRARHVVTEDARVLAVAELLRAGRVRDIGPALDASHASMRDDFEITVPTVDLAVATARAAGALGARMTGGGFGGCIIALTPAGEADRIARQVARAFDDNGFNAPQWFTAEPAAGAGRVHNDSAN